MSRPRQFDRLNIKKYLSFSSDQSIMQFNATRNLLEFNGSNLPSSGYPVEIRGLQMAPDRVELTEWFSAPPQLSAVTQAPAADTYNTASFLANQKANHQFEVLGTNAASADVALGAEGGITVQTHGSSNDSTIILPHLTSGQSAWTSWTWGSDRHTRYECTLLTPSAVTSVAIWAGLKLTNTPVGATDNDQAFFLFDTGASANATYWHTWSSNNNTDTETAVTSTASGAPGAVAASTKYHLVVDIDSSRNARFYINGFFANSATFTTLKDTTDFIPYIGIKQLSASQRSMSVYKARISRRVGATG